MFDLKVLGKRLEAKGIVLAEDALEILASETLDFISESAVSSGKPLGLVLAAVIPEIKKALLEQIDKIDHVQG